MGYMEVKHKAEYQPLKGTPLYLFLPLMQVNSMGTRMSIETTEYFGTRVKVKSVT